MNIMNDLKKAEYKEPVAIRFNNDFRKISLSVYSNIEAEIAFVAIKFLTDNQTQSVSVSYKEFRDAVISRVKAKDFDGIFYRILQTQVIMIGDIKQRYVNLFSSIEVSEKRDTVLITATQEGYDFFSMEKMSNGYGVIDFIEYTSLKNRYARELYRSVMQFIKTGVYKVSYDDFIQKMAPPKTYTPARVREKVIEPAIRAVRKYFADLHLEEIDEFGYDNPPKVLTFKFTPIGRRARHEKLWMPDDGTGNVLGPDFEGDINLKPGPNPKEE